MNLPLHLYTTLFSQSNTVYLFERFKTRAIYSRREAVGSNPTGDNCLFEGEFAMMLHLRVIYVRQFLLISLNAEQRILFYNADEKVLDSFILPLLLISVGALLTSTAAITIVIINLRQIHGVQSLIARSLIGLRNRLLWWIL